MNNTNISERASSSSDNQPRRETRYGIRKRLEESEAAKNEEIERKRRKLLFEHQSKRIHPNDIIVNQLANKVKLECPENIASVVKEEPENNYQDADSYFNIKPEIEEKIVTSEIHLQTDFAKFSLNDQADKTQAGIVKIEQETEYTETPDNFEAEENHDARGLTVDVVPSFEQQLHNLQQESESKNRTIKQMQENHQKAVEIQRKKIESLQKLLLEHKEKDGNQNKNIEKLSLELDSKNTEIKKLKETNNKNVKILERRLETANTYCSPHKVLSLFKEVLPVYLLHIYPKYITADFNKDVHMTILCPCRLTCKAWKDVVDSLMKCPFQI